MKKHREHNRRSLLAAALLAIAAGPVWAGDAERVADEQYRAFLLQELRQNLKESIQSLSLERADVVHRIAVQEARSENERRDQNAPDARGWKSSGATL